MLRPPNLESSSSSDEDSNIPSSASSDSDSCSGWNNCCICGHFRGADWDDDCKQCYKLKFDISKVENPHDELHRAIAKHHCRTIRQLLEDGVKPCTTKKIKNCFLLAVDKSTFILKKLLDIEPLGVNCQDSKGLTMLMLSKRIPTFELLCNYKPDVNLLNNDGNNILFHLLKTHEQFDIPELKQIMDLGLDVNAVNRKGETALVYAFRKSFGVSTIVTLFEAGAQLPSPDKDPGSIVINAIKSHHLSSSDNIKLLEVLIKYEVDVSVKDSDGHNVMYHTIKKYIKELACRNRYQPIPLNLELEEILIMLLQKNCEVQGLDVTLFDTVDEATISCLYTQLPIQENWDIIAIFAQSGPSVKFLEQLVNRGLYNWTASSKLFREKYPEKQQPISPLTACLDRLCSYTFSVNLREILQTCKYLISIGVEVTHRTQGRNLRFDVGKCCARKFCTSFPAVIGDLLYPDAFLFFAEYDINMGRAADLEELSRLLLRFWPYPPLFMMLLRVDEGWDKKTPENFRVTPSETLIMKLLIKIGGPVPLGTCYYKSITNYMAEGSGD